MVNKKNKQLNIIFIVIITIIIIFIGFILYLMIRDGSKSKHMSKTNEKFKSSVISTHNAGFFSCCTVKLCDIVKFVNSNRKLPDRVDSSQQFNLYKPNINKNKDITYHYFKHENNNIKNINIQYPIHLNNGCQYKDYSKLDYKNIVPLVEKYFSPSHKINCKINYLTKKYNINYNNTLAVYYRGTDKTKETKITGFKYFYNRINEIIKVEPNLNVIVQTDTSQFIDYINNKNLNNIIIFNENDTSYSNKGIHNEKTNLHNYNQMFNLLSTFIILSKCKYVICSSGNCSLWIMLYRKNAKNVIQYINDKWYKNI